MIVHMCTVILRVLHIMSALAVAKCAANAVAQKCKVLSCPSKCILICRLKSQSKGHYVMIRVWTYPCLIPGKVETRGSTQLVGKPLPQRKPSASRHDATSEKKLKLL